MKIFLQVFTLVFFFISCMKDDTSHITFSGNIKNNRLLQNPLNTDNREVNSEDDLGSTERGKIYLRFFENISDIDITLYLSYICLKM